MQVQTARRTRTARSVRTQNENTMKIARAMFSDEREFTLDAKGRKVRVFTRENPCTREDVMTLVKGVRGFDEGEALETVGLNVFNYMKQQGYIVKYMPTSDIWMLTTKAQEAYGLPTPAVGPFVKG